MSYTVGFTEKNRTEISETETPTANQAVALVAALRQGAQEIKFIRSPQEGDMGIEMLLLLAKEEAEEMPMAFSNQVHSGSRKETASRQKIRARF
jgi:hypothetical protein